MKRGMGWRAILAMAALTGAAACGGSESQSDAGSIAVPVVCAGEPVACGLLGKNECAVAPGCAPGACSGTAADCASIATRVECILQQGCNASAGASTCAGAPLACLAFSSAETCRGQKGCAWAEGCAGRAIACENLTEAACSLQPGCHLVDASDAQARDGGAPAVPPSNACADAAVPPALMIDDMEDRTSGISSSAYYGGWYLFNDGTPGARQTPDPQTPFEMELIPGGRCASEYAMRTTGTGFTEWGVGMGFDFGYSPLADGSEGKIAIDASAYRGVSFWARVGQAVSTRIVINIVGGLCPGDAGSASTSPIVAPISACFTSVSLPITLTTEWARYDVTFEQLASRPGAQGFLQNRIYSMLFDIPANATFDTWIDDISWLP